MGGGDRARQAYPNRPAALKTPPVSAVLRLERHRRFRVEGGDGQVCYVMDLIEGRIRDQLCGGRPTDAERVAALLRKLAPAVREMGR